MVTTEEAKQQSTAAQAAEPTTTFAEYERIKRERKAARAVTATLQSGIRVRYTPADLAALTASGALPARLVLKYAQAARDRDRSAGKDAPTEEDARRLAAVALANMTEEDIAQQMVLMRQLVVENMIEPELAVGLSGQVVFRWTSGEESTVDPEDFTELQRLIFGEKETRQTAALRTFRPKRQRRTPTSR